MSADLQDPKLPQSAPVSPQKATPSRRRSSSWTPEGLFRIRRATGDSAELRPCRWSGTPGGFDAYARDPLVQSPEGESRNLQGGRFTGNHTSKGRSVLRSLLQKPANYRTQAEKIYAHFRRTQLESVAMDVFESLYQLLQAQVRHYTENPDLVDRFVFDERKRAQIYRSILEQFCGYQLDFQSLLMEDVDALPSLGEQMRSRLETVLALISNRSFILLTQLKAAVLREMGDIAAIPTVDFFGRFNVALMKNKMVFLAMNSLQARWIATRLQMEERDEWAMGYVSLTWDMRAAKAMNERQIRSFDLLRLISLVNAAREAYRTNRTYQCLHDECLRRFALLQSAEMDDHLLHELRVVDSARHFPFPAIKERVILFINQERSLDPISEETWAALERQVTETVLPPDVLLRFSFWQLVETFYISHSLCEVIPLEILRLYDTLKVSLQPMTVCPPYNEQNSVEVEELKTWLRAINVYADSIGDSQLFTDPMIESVTLVDLSGSAVVEAVKPVLTFTLSALQTLVPRFSDSAARLEVSPLLHWIIAHTEKLREQLNEEAFQVALFTNPLLFPELMPSLLSYGDRELLHDLLLGHLGFSESEDRFAALLQIICEEYALTCRLDEARLEIIAYATVLNMMAVYNQGNMTAHVQQINILFKHDIRAVFSYLEGMPEEDFQALEERLGAIDFLFTVDPNNQAIRPYLLLRSAPAYQRAASFTDWLVLAKHAASRMMQSYTLHAEKDCNLLSPLAEQGKAWLAAFFKIERMVYERTRQDATAASSHHYCDVVALTFHPSRANHQKLVAKVKKQVKVYRSRLGDRPDAKEASRWDAKLKLLSGLSRFFTESVTGDAYVAEEVEIATILSQLKAIASVQLPWGQKQERYSIGHKSLSYAEARLAMYGSTCRGIINDFIKLLKSQQPAAAGAVEAVSR